MIGRSDTTIFVGQDSLIGTFVFIAFNIIIVFLMINLFLVVIGMHFNKVRAETELSENFKDGRLLVEYFKKKYNIVKSVVGNKMNSKPKMNNDQLLRPEAYESDYTNRIKDLDLRFNDIIENIDKS